MIHSWKFEWLGCAVRPKSNPFSVDLTDFQFISGTIIWILTHWGRDKMAAILQTRFWKLWPKCFVLASFSKLLTKQVVLTWSLNLYISLDQLIWATISIPNHEIFSFTQFERVNMRLFSLSMKSLPSLFYHIEIDRKNISFTCAIWRLNIKRHYNIIFNISKLLTICVLFRCRSWRSTPLFTNLYTILFRDQSRYAPSQ